MGSILEKIEQALKDMLIGWIESNLTNMFTDVNEKVGTIAAEVGQTPSGWNGGVYQMIRGLSENVIVPIAGIIITFVLCYELISMITEKNNLHDMDTWMFFKWFFKAAVAIYLVTHTFDIVMAVFDIGQNVVSGAAGVIHGNTSIDIDATIAQMRTGMENMGVGELLGLSIETLLISLCLKIMAILIKKAYDEQYADLSRRLDEAVQRKVKFAEAMSEDNKWLTLMKSVSGATMLSQELVDESVELVKVHEDGSIELVMKYGDIYALTVQSIKEVQEAM